MVAQFGVMRTPRLILFGAGQRRGLGRVVGGAGKRALVCTDKRYGATSEMAELRGLLADHGIAVQVFDATEAELPLSGILACVEAARPF
jgi:alcohol dehydrogenase